VTANRSRLTSPCGQLPEGPPLVIRGAASLAFLRLNCTGDTPGPQSTKSERLVTIGRLLDEMVHAGVFLGRYLPEKRKLQSTLASPIIIGGNEAKRGPSPTG